MDPSGRSELDKAFASFASGRDPEDLAKVFDGASPRLLLVGMHLLGDAAAAEDLLQTTFLDAIRGAHRFDPGRPVMPWLLTILTRRAGKLRRGRGLEKRVEAELDALQAEAKEPSDLAAEREVIEQISDAVERLSGPYREVLMLRLVHDLRPVEIARALNRPLGTVHAQLHRGLERLRKILPKSLAGALALLTGAERGLAAVRQRVCEEAGRQVLPVVGAVVGGLWMKKLLAAAAAMLLLLAGGTWVLVGEHGAAIDSPPKVPGLSQVSMSVSDAGATQENPSTMPTEQRLPVVAPSKEVVFTGRVVAAESGASIAGAEVSLHAFQSGVRNPGTAKWDDPSVVTSGMDGRFEIAIGQHSGMGIDFSAHVPGRVKTVGSVSEFRPGISVELGDVPVFAGSEVHIRVIDDRGEPVEGVGLHLDPVSRSDSVHLGGLIALHPRGWGGMATTDTSGWVPPVRLQPGRWQVLIDNSSGLGLTGPDEILVESGDPARTLTITLSTPDSERTISGTVVDMRGHRMPGFELWGMQADRVGYSSVRSRSDGGFLFGVLAPERGPVTVNLKDQRHFELISPKDAVELGTSGLEVVVRSIETRTLTIEVVDQDQLPVEEFRYCLVPTKHDRWGTRLLQHSLKMSNEVLHRDGIVLAERVVPGSYLLYVRGENARFASVQSISIDVRLRGAIAVRMILVDQHRWAVRVLDESGEPRPGSRVELLQAVGHTPISNKGIGSYVLSLGDAFEWGVGGTHMVLRSDEAISDERGLAQIHSAKALGVAAIRVTNPAHLPVLVEIEALPSASQPFEVVVQGAAMIEGEIGPLETVIAWGPVAMEHERSAYFVSNQESLARRLPRIIAVPLGVASPASEYLASPIDHLGRFRLESLPPGDWQLSFQGGKQTAASQLRYKVEDVIALKPGEIRRVDLTLTDLEPARISGVAFVDDELAVGMKLVLKGSGWIETPIGLDGRFQTKLIPAGNYSASLKAEFIRDGSWRLDADAQIEVAPGESVDCVLRFTRHSLSVRILDAEGSPIEFRWMTLESREWSGSENYDYLDQAKSDSDGRVVFDPVPNRDLYVLVWNEGTLPTRGFGPVKRSEHYSLLGPIRIQSDRSSTELELRLPARK